MGSIVGATAMHPADVLKYQDELVRTKQYSYLGKALCIIVEAARGANTPPEAVTNIYGVRLDFYNAPVPIAASLDRSQLLFLAPFLRADGKVGLPDIPDPSWRPGKPPHLEGAIVVHDQPRMIPQPLRQYASGLLKGTNFLVIEPIMQLAYHVTDTAEGRLIQCGADPATRTHVALLVDEQTGKAHFYGGRFVLG